MPNYDIDYPCLGTVIDPDAFNEFATDVEAALATVDAEVTALTRMPYAQASLTSNTALGVEAAMTIVSPSSEGITVGATTFTVITPGLYAIAASLGGNQSTLTMTSQRIAVAVNGVNVVAGKWRGSNPADPTVRDGGYSTDVPLAAGDLVSFRFLWTGTGVLSGPAGGRCGLDLLATP